MTSSHAHGPVDVPLLGETIGENLRRTVERFGDREALVVRHQDYRATYRELWDQVDHAARGLSRAACRRATASASGRPTASSGSSLQYATARDRRDPRQRSTRPTRRPSWSTRSTRRASACSAWRAASGRPTTSRCSREVRAALPDAARRARARRRLGRVPRRRRGVAATELAAREATLAVRRPDQHPVHLGHHRLPQGRDAVAPQHPQQRLLRRRALRYTERDRVCVPVPFYHCFGMVLGNLALHDARRVHGRARRGVRPARRAGDGRRPSAARRSTACRRCSSPSSTTRASTSSTSRACAPGIMAGAPCPVEVMQQVQIADAHGARSTIGYGMTETSPVSTQTAPTTRWRSASAPSAASTRTSRSRSSTRRRARSCRAARRASCARAATASCSATGTTRPRPRGAIDAAGWMHTGDLAMMDDDGYVSIVGRIKDMIIRGGENIYPREIEEFLHTHPGVSEAQVIGVPSAKYGEEVMAWVQLQRRRDAHRGRAARVLPRADRDVQDPALLEVRRRLPDDGDGQGPEVPHARDRRRRGSVAAVDVCSLCHRAIDGPRLTDPVCHPACVVSRLPGDAVLAIVAPALLLPVPPVVVWAG